MTTGIGMREQMLGLQQNRPTPWNDSDKVLLSFASLSMFCDICLVGVYVFNRSVRSLHIWKIITCISICDFVTMSTYWIAISPSFEPCPENMLCRVQASLSQFSMLATILFHNAIAFELVIAVSNPTRSFSLARFEKKFRLCVLAILVLCTAATVVLNTKNLIGSNVSIAPDDDTMESYCSYSPSSVDISSEESPPLFCWIEPDKLTAIWWLHYVPVLATFVLCISGFTYAAILLHQRDLRLSVHAQFYLGYMLLFLVLWIPPLVKRFVSTNWNSKLNPLFAACIAGHGFVSAVAWVASLRMHGNWGCCSLDEAKSVEETAEQNEEDSRSPGRDDDGMHRSYAVATFGRVESSYTYSESYEESAEGYGGYSFGYR
jgi:hypothetical protein